MAKEFIPVNDLLGRTTLEQFIDHYNFDTEVRRKGNEERIRNPFACDKCQGNQQAVSVNWKSAVFTSHCYSCSVRGRVTTLLFGMKYGRQPTGGALKGEEFKDIAADIAQVAGHRRTAPQEIANAVDAGPNSPAADTNSEPSRSAERKINLPLARNPDERIARLVHLSDELIRDPAAMSGRAQAYLSTREYMTQEVMEEWDIGYLPSNSKSMLRSKFVYALRNERSEKIGYVGRDLAFSDKILKWENSDRTGKVPIKAKFPPGFARGEFLYGAEASRLNSGQARQQLESTGLIVVEGMNDVVALDRFGFLAVGLCSNRVSEGQKKKLIRWSKGLANGKITFMLDNDEEGRRGTRESIEKLAPYVHVATVWRHDPDSVQLNCVQPEDMKMDGLMRLLQMTIATKSATR